MTTAPALAWPSVTVVIPTRGRPDRLREAIRSALAQDYPGAIECLVVFDQQEPVELDVETAADRAVRSLANSRTPGPAGARNTGMVAAEGALIALLDDDDRWLPGKVRAQVQALAAHPGTLVVGCGIELATPRRTFQRIPPAEVTLADLTQQRHTAVHTSTLLFRAEALDRIGLLDESIPAGYGEDYDWLYRVAQAGPIRTVPTPLAWIAMNDSWFANRWALLADSLTWQLDHRPELFASSRNAARVASRIAFALAASGQRRRAWPWARRALAADWRQPRAYLALLVAGRLLSPRPVVWAARSMGRGI